MFKNLRIMKIFRILPALLVAVLFVACESDDKLIDDIQADIERGAVLRTITNSPNSFVFDDPTSEWVITWEAQDIEDGALFDDIEIYVDFVDNTPEDGTVETARHPTGLDERLRCPVCGPRVLGLATGGVERFCTSLARFDLHGRVLGDRIRCYSPVRRRRDSGDRQTDRARSLHDLAGHLGCHDVHSADPVRCPPDKGLQRGRGRHLPGGRNGHVSDS